MNSREKSILKTNHKAAPLLIACCLLWLAACQLIPPEPNIILEDPVCSPPCWNGITPEKTTVDEAVKILEKSTSIGVNNIRPDSQPRYGYDFIFWAYQDKWDGFLISQNDLVVMIRFAYQKSSLKITLSQAIDKYGEPEIVFSEINPDSPAWGGLSFINPGRGVIYTYYAHEERNKYRLELRPETSIATVTYFLPEDYEKAFNYLSPYKSDWPKEEYEASLYPWKGYGNIAEKYPLGGVKK